MYDNLAVNLASSKAEPDKWHFYYNYCIHVQICLSVKSCYVDEKDMICLINIKINNVLLKIFAKYLKLKLARISRLSNFKLNSIKTNR